MSLAERKDLLERLRSAAPDAPNGEILREAADLVERSYYDGFDAACDIASSVQLKVSCQMDPAIQLGVRTVSSILSEQCRNVRRSIQEGGGK